MKKLQDKVTIITGGSAGIGRETALLFAKEGASVVITDLNEEKGLSVVKEIEALQGQALFIKHDVSNEDDWGRVVSKTLESFRKIDVLFNNAGIYIIQAIPDITLETWNKLMSINVTGVFLGLKHVLPVMAKNKRGSIINASSIAGLKGSPGHLLYGASKGAVRVMTKDAAAEYAPQNIRVNSIHPGYITTAMADYASEQTHRTPKELAELFPLGRMGSPLEVAKMVLFLASDDSSFSTGSEFVIDGGATAK